MIEGVAYINFIYHIIEKILFINCPRSEPEVMKRTGSANPVIDPDKPFFMSSDQIER